MACDWVSEHQPTPNIIEDTPEFGGVGPTTQHEICIKPTAAVAINTAAYQKGAEQMAQPDPDPDPDRAASEVSSAADGDSSTEDLPTIVDGSPSPMHGGQGLQGEHSGRCSLYANV